MIVENQKSQILKTYLSLPFTLEKEISMWLELQDFPIIPASLHHLAK